MTRPFDLLFPEVEREASIEAGMCSKPPLGCGQPVKGFDDELSVREYQISGLCQVCQDKVFAEPEEDDDYDWFDDQDEGGPVFSVDVALVTEMTLRKVSEWLESDRDKAEVRDIATRIYFMDEGTACCPLCEEVDCDDDCPLSFVRVDRCTCCGLVRGAHKMSCSTIK